MASGKPDQVSGLVEFRSRATIKAMYFDGSLASGLDIARTFHSVQIEFTGNEDFLLRYDGCYFIKPHTWIYKNGNGRIENRDHEELNKHWEQRNESGTDRLHRRRSK